MENLVKLTAEQIERKLALHELWLNTDGESGIQANFSNADLQEVDFSNRDLQQADFMGANLQSANFEGANLKGTSFDYANLKDACLKYSNIDEAILYKTDLHNVSADDIVTMGTSENTTVYFYRHDRVVNDWFDGTLKEFENTISAKFEPNTEYFIVFQAFRMYETFGKHN